MSMLMTVTMAADTRALERQATELLWRNGYRADGRPRKTVSWEQRCFERRMTKAPFSGKSIRSR